MRDAAKISCPLCGKPFVQGECDVAVVSDKEKKTRVAARCLRITGPSRTCRGLLESPLLDLAREIGNREGRIDKALEIARAMEAK